MTENLIRDLFVSDISREIEEVIKVDQDDQQLLSDELAEYIATDSIRAHYRRILERYAETPNKPHEGIGVWVSGFFGSGKSSFAKYLGLALEDRQVLDRGASELLGDRIGDKTVSVLLKTIAEKVPTHAVIFDVSADRGIRSGNQTITEIMYRLFLKSLGYATDLDLAELEITLEAEDRLDQFAAHYEQTFGKSWDADKGLIAFAMQKASRVMHELDPMTFTTVDSWRESVKGRADITPTLLADRSIELLDRRKPGHSLAFVVDEVGQFVARDIQKMLDLQAAVQQLGRAGRGRLWLVVTSQEKLSELVGGLDDKRVELARLMDRFPLQVHLEPADISEVTSKRILTKSAEAEPQLRELFAANRARLTDNSKITAAIELPELQTDNFVELYPLLPYQIDLIINVVSGLRTAGGASKHVGGANRTIIKLAQQLLIHPGVALADDQVGALARLDQIYDLVSNNISSEIRGKIDGIPNQVSHPMAQPVAKAIALLQFAQSIHRTAENIAATLHPAVDADSRLSEVRDALSALEAGRLVREGDDGYRIPTPSEDDWEAQRASIGPKPVDLGRIYTDSVKSQWQPQPSHLLAGVRAFKAALLVDGRSVVEGDLDVNLTLADQSEVDERTADAKTRSQAEPASVFWVAALSDAIDREAAELFRSREILSRKERGAKSNAETALVAEEKRRQRRHEDELRRLLKAAVLSGTAFFRGNDRSPRGSSKDVVKATASVLAGALPEVFSRFGEAAARIGKKDLEALTKGEDLDGLTPVFSNLSLVREEGGKTVIDTASPPLAEMLGRIADRTAYGEKPTGRYLIDEFGKEPFGWDLESIRLFAVALVRAGKLQATSKGQVVDSATSLIGRTTFDNNNLFKSASFQPKGDGPSFEDAVKASSHFKDAFGREVPELEPGAVARELRGEVEKQEPAIRNAHVALVQHGLPGAAVLETALDQINVIRSGSDEQAISTFNASFKEIKEAIKRASELEGKLGADELVALLEARHVLLDRWPFLAMEQDVTDEELAAAAALEDLLARETFFREIAEITRQGERLQGGYETRLAGAVAARADVYTHGMNELRANPDWVKLSDDQQKEVAEPIRRRMQPPGEEELSIPLLREQVASCAGAVTTAIEKLHAMIEGDRLASVSLATYFSGGIETEDQLEAALDGLKAEIAELLRAGKKVIVR